MSMLELPDKPEALVATLDDAIHEAELVRNYWSVSWQVAGAYLNGARRFWVYDWDTGDVRVGYEGDRSAMTFRYEDILRQYRVEMGRYLRMDLDPVPARDAYGLEDVRKNAMAYAITKYMLGCVGSQRIREVRRRFFELLLIYGTAGLYHYRGDWGDFGQKTQIEAVCPWELLSIPGKVYCEEDVRGTVRSRLVPLNWLKSLKERGALDRVGSEAEMEVLTMGAGQSPVGDGPMDRLGDRAISSATSEIRRGRSFESAESFDKTRGRRRGQGQSMRAADRQQSQKWVRMDEVFLWSERPGWVGRYIVRLGKTIGLDETYEGPGVPSKLQIARFSPIGRFYGRSWVGQIMALNDQNEKMASNQFQNVQDLDLYGITVIRSTSGISRSEAQKPERRKVLIAEPDYTAPSQPSVEVFQPANTTDFPGKILNLGIQLQDKMSGQSSLYGGEVPGARLDSAAALGFLFETGNVNLVMTGDEVSDAWVGIYRSMLHAAREELEAPEGEQGGGFRIPVLDERLLGVSLEEDGVTVSLGSNPIPQPWETNLEVRDRVPSSREKQRQEATEMLGAGLISLSDFEILNNREGWGFPSVDRVAWETYRRTVWLALRLFNDGQTPGQVSVMPTEDHSETTLKVLKGIMATLEFAYSSPQVKQVFIQWKESAEMAAGMGGFPSQMPYPDQMGETPQGPSGPPGMGMGPGSKNGVPQMAGSGPGRGAPQARR